MSSTIYFQVLYVHLTRLLIWHVLGSVLKNIKDHMRLLLDQC